MSKPLVSCLVTAYNYERFLERAVESALAQDYPELEVVVVNDGSTDGTAAVADSLVARHPGRVRVFHQENTGWIGAFNHAISEARGDLLAILDADDTWLPGKLRAQVDLLEARPEVGLVYSDLAVIDEHDTIVKPSFWDDKSVHPFDGRCAAGLVTVGNTATTSSIVVRAALRDAFFPIPADVPYGDWWIAFRTACLSELAYVREPLVGYRFHGSNQTFDVQGDALVRELRKEHLFRRIALARLEPGVLTVIEHVQAYAALEASAWTVLAAAGSALTALPPCRPDDAERELTAADGAAPLTRLRLLLRAVALDPANDAVRARFTDVANLLANEPQAREPVAVPEGFLALAFLDEVIETPDLLSDYAKVFAGNDCSTLVILAPGADPEVLQRGLEPVAARLGLDSPDSAEVVVLTEDGGGERLAAAADALYTRLPRNGAYGHLPKAARADALLRLVAPVAPSEGASSGFLALGFLDEVIQTPDLLQEFARAFDGEDAVTLVLLAPGHDPSLLDRALAPVAAALGLDRDGSADIVVLTDPGAEAPLLDSVRAVYSRLPQNGAFASLPQTANADELLRLAGRV